MLLWLHSMGDLSGEHLVCCHGFDAEDGLTGHTFYFFRQGRFSKLNGISLGSKNRGRSERGSCAGECPSQFEYIE